MNSPLKWMGSKKKLIPFIEQFIPKNYNTLVEPFVGSGIVTFSQEPESAIVADLQAEPIAIFRSIKNKPEAFHALFIKYSQELWEGGSDYYYATRKEYNAKKDDMHEVKRAAMFMVLLRAGFNGLIRFNPKGEWNVPFGDRGHAQSKTRPTPLHAMFPWEKIEEWNSFLNSGKKQILHQSFEKTISQTAEGDVIYADPPYLITTQQYKTWNEGHELLLANELRAADKRGVKFMLSNVYEYKGKINDNLMELYEGFEYKIKPHSYVVGPKSSRRQSVQEIIIFN